MLGGRAKLPVLAEISGPAPAATRVWSLRREDFERLSELLPLLEERRVLLVSGGAEAAPLAAVAIAAASAASGRRTVLLECDLARPRLASQVGLAEAPGLHEYLCWEAQSAHVLQPLVLAGSASAPAEEPLTCITAGTPASDPETLLGLQSFDHVVSKLRGAYQRVVLAGPDATSDSRSLEAVARRADAVLAALPTSQIKGRHGRPLRAAIRQLPAPALGALAIGG
jgi:succinoglycan biosynthesis transport protein ExoP